MVRRTFVLMTLVGLFIAVTPVAAGAGAPDATLFVGSDASWVSTGVVVEVGDDLSIRAHGQAITGPLSEFPGAHSGPDGQLYDCPDPGGPTTACNLDAAPYGALVANIGGTIFVVGGSYIGTAPASGEILLAVNDNLGFHFDNKAGFATQIRTG
jgi:hypothetical protein